MPSTTDDRVAQPSRTKVAIVLAALGLLAACTPTLVTDKPTTGVPRHLEAGMWRASVDLRDFAEPDAKIDENAAVATPAEAIVGLASWYGPRFHGRRTSSGERFDQRQLTAAHKSLPFGTRVLVSNPTTGRSVEVRITDRGPRSPNRVIDLSRAAAEAIGMRHAGVTTVSLQVLPIDPDDLTAQRQAPATPPPRPRS
jgi:hypothetical protein